MKFHLLSAIVMMMIFNLIGNIIIAVLAHQKKLDPNSEVIKGLTIVSGGLYTVLLIMLTRKVIKSGWTI